MNPQGFMPPNRIDILQVNFRKLGIKYQTIPHVNVCSPLFSRFCMMGFVLYVWLRSVSSSFCRETGLRKYISLISLCQVMMEQNTRISPMRWPWRKCTWLIRKTRWLFNQDFNEPHNMQFNLSVVLCTFMLCVTRFTAESQHLQSCIAP